MSAATPEADRELLARVSEVAGLYWKELDAIAYRMETLAKNPRARLSTADRDWLQRLARRYGVLNGAAEADDPTVYVPRHGQPLS